MFEQNTLQAYSIQTQFFVFVLMPKQKVTCIAET
jgi:hypothetical protein